MGLHAHNVEKGGHCSLMSRVQYVDYSKGKIPGKLWIVYIKMVLLKRSQYVMDATRIILPMNKYLTSLWKNNEIKSKIKEIKKTGRNTPRVKRI
jgi:hypothetical protein